MDPRTILHVDMDAFFAAIEQLDRPELRGLPVIVGAQPDARGVVATCSYEARRFGVRSAMPSQTAFKLCPQGVFVPPRGARYSEVSRRVFEVFEHFTPLVEPLSIDEAFLDITGSMKLFGGGEATARQLQGELLTTTGLTGSVGLAGNKFLAKLASDMNKPNGLTVVPRAQPEIERFLAPLPLTRIWGIGAKTAARLEAAGLTHVGQVQQLNETRLCELLGGHGGPRLKRLAHGFDERDVVTEHQDKSISHEHTFGHDCSDWERVSAKLVVLAEKVGVRLRRQGLEARTAQLKLRWSDFTTITRQQPLQPPGSTDRQLIDAALALMRREVCKRPVRLIGFGVSGFDHEQAAAWQPDLFASAASDAERTRDAKLDSAVDQLRATFGHAAVTRGWATGDGADRDQT